MRELILPFRKKEHLKNMIISILAFVGMAVPFKVMVLIEGFTEVRPVNAVPIVVGLLFGPAGAWGCAIGNLIADVFGTFSKASILGFFGNFIASYSAYKLWHIVKKGEVPNTKNNKSIGIYIIISLISSLITAIFLSCGLDVFFGFWSYDMFRIILLNDAIFPLVFGLPVFIMITCDDNNIDIYMPREISKDSLVLKISCIILIISSVSIFIIILMGYSMSSFLFMLIMGIIFLLSLFSFIILQ